jgi:hypothetical protein
MITVAALAGVALYAGNALAASDYECRIYAQQQADQYNPTGKGLIVGGALGALGGAGIAAIAGGNAGTGAIVGGVAGGTYGGISNQQQRQKVYESAYWSCRNGGAQPQPVYNPGTAPPGCGQQYWMQQCAAKYNSFQWSGPNACQFKGYDGYWHWCSVPSY